MRLLAALALAAAMSIDTSRSSITVYVAKQGLFSFLADNHTIAAPIARGSYDAQHGSATLAIDASQLRVLDPGLSASKRASVQSNMTGPQVLDAAKYPTIEFTSTKIANDGTGTLAVTGNLELHGQTRPVSFMLHERSRGHFTGTTTLRQTSFGIVPIRIAGGAVSVRDEVRIDFDIQLSGSTQ